MSTSQNYFEGYCRSRDTLQTLVDKITSASIANPWTVKSQGRVGAAGIVGTVWDSTKPNFGYGNCPYICLKRQMSDGRVYNLLFIESWNTPTNNFYGNIAMSASLNDGIDVPNLTMNGIFSNRTRQHVFRVINYHSTQVADTDGLPEFAWYWIYVDEDTLFLSLYGNIGGQGTATSDSSYLFFGKAKSSNTTKFKDSIIFAPMTNNNPNYDGAYINYTTCDFSLSDGNIDDYITPNFAPFDWTTSFSSKWFQDIVDGNGVNSNPDNVLGTNIITTPKLFQGTIDNGGYGWYQQSVLTHLVGDNRFFFCQPGNGTLRRGDIVVIDSLGCDYTYLQLGARGEVWSNYLMKRMESVTDLIATSDIGKIVLSWRNPARFYGVKIVRNTTAYPTSYKDGITVFDNNIDGTLVPNEITNFDDSTVAAQTTYYYAAFAYSSSEIYSVPVKSAKINITSL